MGDTTPTNRQREQAVFELAHPLAGAALAGWFLMMSTGIVFAAAVIVADPDPRTWSFLIAFAVVTACAFAFAQLTRTLTVRPALIIDASGIWDRRTMRRPVRWKAIGTIRLMSSGMVQSVALDLKERPATIWTHVRHRANSLWSDPTRISLNLLLKERDRVVEAIHYFGPPELTLALRPAPAPHTATRRYLEAVLGYAGAGFFIVLPICALLLFPGLIAAVFEKTGNFYGWSIVRSVDRHEQIEWYRRSVDWGSRSPRVVALLAVRYESGEGVVQDHAEAARLYRILAERGLPWAQTQLGRLYEEGLGVERDLDQAKRWTRGAALRGDQDAKARWERLAGPEPLTRQIPSHTPR